MQSPDIESPVPLQRVRREASGSSITPRGSPTRQLEQPPPTPLVPQTTGEWFPSFRRSLLGGKQLNRFSSFVTSGAEEWVLQGAEDKEPVSPVGRGHGRELSTASIVEENGGLGEADKHFVEAGPAWKTKVPPFRILVHSPSKRTSMLSGSYTMYSITSLFSPDAPPEEDDEDPVPQSPMRITVHRRFSHFVVLHTALTRRLPGIALPPLPEKQYAGRFNDDFVEARRGDLERYLSRVVRHPVARYAEVLTFFLGCESEIVSGSPRRILAFRSYVLRRNGKGSTLNTCPTRRPVPRSTLMFSTLPSTWTRKKLSRLSTVSTYTRVLWARVCKDSGISMVGCDKRASVSAAFDLLSRARADRFIPEMSQAQRLLSYSLLSLITSKPLAEASTTGIAAEEDDRDPKLEGHLNEDGAWCWREGCTGKSALPHFPQNREFTFPQNV